MNPQSDPRLSCTELESLRTSLGLESTSDRRRHTRHTLPKGFVVAVKMSGADGSWSTFAATGRDISASGIGLFHAAHIEHGASCEVELRTVSGDVATIPGTVVRSAPIGARLHDLGIEFHFEIEPAEFVRSAGTTATREAMNGMSAAEDLATRLMDELSGLVDAKADWARVAAKLREVRRAMNDGRRGS